ncbi:S26 family signal peptidase [Halorubellus sp. JP-L1]|uniref:S26 family signal peptidase n=1 Tax=Halorubellus sp. JP-L1 TaxID=2715753 RepID=UPI001409A830|nr:S26 family signal peptidase [Halorubellus sp. JP-L1]NHN43434.1 S26 family signal peptidase [Halorubellus sp. JP-L1]
MTGHDPDDRGDDADGTPTEADDRPDGWPDDWTTADDDTHAADDDTHAADDDTHAADDAPPAGDDATTRSDPIDDDDATVVDGVEGERARDVDESDGDVAATTATDGSVAATSNTDSAASTADAESTLGERTAPEKPPARTTGDDQPTIADDGLYTWFMNTHNGAVVLVRDVLSSVAAVAVIGLVLFAISGIWPPLVAVESGSMEPHMSKGDLVFIVDEDRYVPQSGVEDTGISTYESANAANGYSKFGSQGDVVVYSPYGDDRRTPIIHRAQFYVEEGENWVEDADPAYLGGVDSCAEVPRDMCPAPYDGFITKGDANPTYDQVGDQSTIVKDEWVRGKAEVRVPLLGWIRLQFAKLALTGPTPLGSSTELFARLGALGLAGATVFATRR